MREKALDKEFKRQTKEIIETFDFNRVHDVMTFLNWKYNFGAEDSVPNTQELKTHAETMLNFISGTSIKHIRSGGFVAEKYISNQGSKLILSFEIASITASMYAG